MPKLSTSKAPFTTVFLLVFLSRATLCDAKCGGGSPKYQTMVDGNLSCLPCSKCPPGTGVWRHCDENNDTECQACPMGTYSSRWSRTETCRPCTACSSHLEMKKNCTNMKNTKCGKRCERGYFLNDLTNACEECSFCFSESSNYLPRRVVQCVQQGLPEHLQCMPTRKSTHQPRFMKAKSHSGITFNVNEKDNSDVTEESDRKTRVTNSSTAQPEKVYNIPREHYFTVPTIIASIIVICVAVGIAIYCVVQRRRLGALEGNYNVLDETALPESRSEETFQETGYLNPMEELENKNHRSLNYKSLDEDVLWDAGHPHRTATTVT